MENKLSGPLIVVMLIVALIFESFGMLVSKDRAVKALTDQGFSNITVTKRAWFLVGMRGCSGSDAVRFTAKATNPAGKNVEIYVCTGLLFKGATMRSL